MKAHHLVDLQDLAAQESSEADFTARLAALRDSQAGMRTYTARLKAKGL